MIPFEERRTSTLGRPLRHEPTKGRKVGIYLLHWQRWRLSRTTCHPDSFVGIGLVFVFVRSFKPTLVMKKKVSTILSIHNVFVHVRVLSTSVVITLPLKKTKLDDFWNWREPWGRRLILANTTSTIRWISIRLSVPIMSVTERHQWEWRSYEIQTNGILVRTRT